MRRSWSGAEDLGPNTMGDSMLDRRDDQQPGPAVIDTQPASEADLPALDHCLHAATPSRREAIADALRLLATWAVRAARAHREPQNRLDCSPPGSDECTPNPSAREDLT